MEALLEFFIEEGYLLALVVFAIMFAFQAFGKGWKEFWEGEKARRDLLDATDDQDDVGFREAFDPAWRRRFDLGASLLALIALAILPYVYEEVTPSYLSAVFGWVTVLVLAIGSSCWRSIAVRLHDLSEMTLLNARLHTRFLRIVEEAQNTETENAESECDESRS